MRTGLIENWTGNPAEIGPMYPFVGFEMPVVLVCFILWILYTIWQMRFENTHNAREEQELRTSDSKVLREANSKLVKY